MGRAVACALVALGFGLPGAAHAWAPKRDHAEAGEAAAAADEAPSRFRGSTFSWGHHVTKNSLDPGAQLTHDPTYVQSFAFAPRLYLLPELSLRARQDLLLEVTLPNVQHERAVVLDTVLDLVYGQHLPGDIDAFVGPRLRAPLSVTSRASHRLLGLGARADLVRDFRLLEGLSLVLSGRYTHYLANANVVASEGELRCQLAEPGASSVSTLHCGAGPTTVEEDLVAAVGAELSLVEGLSVALSFEGRFQRGAALEGEPVVDTLTGPLVVEGQTLTRWRNTTGTSLAVSYRFLAWLDLTAAVSTATSQLDPDGSRRNPFWGPETELSLTATLRPGGIRTAPGR